MIYFILYLSATQDKCFTKIPNKECTIDNILDISAQYLGVDGFADAKRDCKADETCKSIVDVSKAFGLDQPGERFLLCRSGANEVEDYDSADVWVKGIFYIPMPCK